MPRGRRPARPWRQAGPAVYAAFKLADFDRWVADLQAERAALLCSPGTLIEPYAATRRLSEIDRWLQAAPEVRAALASAAGVDVVSA